MVIFTEEHEAFRKTVRDVVEREIAPYVDEWESLGQFPAHEVFPKLGALGLLGLEYDPAYGGQGADHLFTVILCEELHGCGCGAVPMAVGVQTMMATPSLHHFGSEELKQHYLVPAISGEAVCSIAVTEPDAGSDVAALRTRAVQDGDEWVINGSKLYITNGVQADWICLLARTSDEGGYRGMSQIVVPTDTARLQRVPQAEQTWPLVVRHCRTRLQRHAGAGQQHDRAGRPRISAADGAIRGRADVRGVRSTRRPCRGR